MKDATFTLTLDPAKPFVRDMTKEGWTLESDVEYQPGKVEVELAEFLKPGEARITGYEMAKRAKEIGANFGQKHAEVFLANYERWIPPEGVFHITFPGTVWRDSFGGRSVPCLGWNGEQWHLRFSWLGYSCNSYERLFHSCK